MTGDTYLFDQEPIEAVGDTVPPPPAALTGRMICPDDGTCHHGCTETCWRVGACGPLSGVFPLDEWPVDVLNRHVPGRTVSDYLGVGAAVLTVVEEYALRCHLCGKVKRAPTLDRAAHILAFHMDRRHQNWTHQ